MTTLNQYEFQVADVLRDPNQQIWSIAQLDAYINEARRQVVMDTGCLRSLQLSYITQGVEQYAFGQVGGGVITAGGSGYTTPPTISFAGGGGTGVAATLGVAGGAVNTISFSSFGSGYTSAPIPTITPTGGGTGASVTLGVTNVSSYDILDISIFWGNERCRMGWAAWSEFSRVVRAWTATSYQRLPVMWAVYGDNQFFVGPPPDQTYQIELDTVILPTDLTDYVTADVIPLVTQDPVKFYAAHLAKLNNQAYGEAETLLATYRRRLLECAAAYTRRMPGW